MSNKIQLKMTNLSNRIADAEKQLVRLYNEYGFEDDAIALADELKNVSEDRIRVIFVGQYDAGKSSIISALTGRNDIKISADIATSEVTEYCWGGVGLIDTPGLYTENTIHDEKTKEEIKRSDLVVYCITSDLFNQYTLNDFQKWAFELGYANKMFLLINKMSKEDGGSYSDLVDNYSSTINNAIFPHTVGELTCDFVDTKDYKRGILENNQELIDYSHFNSFINSLNDFINQKGILGRLYVPIMIMKDSIDSIVDRIDANTSNNAYLSLVSRVEKKIDQQRSKTANESYSVVRRELGKIVDYGSELSKKIGIEEITVTENEVNNFIENICNSINNQLSEICENGINQLNADVEELAKGEMASYFVKSIGGTYSEKKTIFETKKNKLNRAQFESFRNLVQQITGKTIKLATNPNTNATGILLKATDASGSELHKVILAIGEKFGHQFKPWEAVNLAKELGNCAKILGPLVAVAGVLFDIKQSNDEKENQENLKKCRISYRQSFIDVAKELEQQYNNEIVGLINEFDNIGKLIQKERSSVLKLVENADSLQRKLLEEKDNLVGIQLECYE